MTKLISTARAELPAEPLARWASVAFSLCVLTMFVSLAASQAFLALASILYAAHLLRHPAPPRFPPVKLPLALFFLTTLISIFFAENPTVGWVDIRKFVLFLILLLAVNLIVTARHLRWLYYGVFLEAALAGLFSVWEFVRQYHEVRALHPGRVYFYMTDTRTTGFMGHWVNFGGQQMLAIICLAAFLLLPGAGIRDSRFEIREGEMAQPRPTLKLWWLVLGIVALSILLNFTRGVWLGCFVAGLYLVARAKPRALWVIPALAAVVYLAAPSLLRQRLNSLRHPSADPSVSIRFEMLDVGLNMMRRHPWVGVGPNNINEVYTLYLPSGRQPEVGYHEHLHNNFVQFAAERGLPCLAAWIWLMVALLWPCWRIRRQTVGLRWVAEGAIAAWIAMVVEGTFEYSFGASPVLMIFLFVAATPFVVEYLRQAQDTGRGITMPPAARSGGQGRPSGFAP